MKRTLVFALLAAVPGAASWAQPMAPQIEGVEVFKNDDVVFHEIDAHTWVGSGHVMASDSLYLVEGDDKAVLIDAGTRIANLDEIVASNHQEAHRAGGDARPSGSHRLGHQRLP